MPASLTDGSGGTDFFVCNDSDLAIQVELFPLAVVALLMSLVVQLVTSFLMAHTLNHKI